MTFSVNESSGEIGQDWGRAKRRNNQNSNRRTQYWGPPACKNTIWLLQKRMMKMRQNYAKFL